MKIKNNLLVTAAALVLSAGASGAATIYDEGVSGDAPPTGNVNFSAPFVALDLGTLFGPQNVVIGSVQGNGADEFDAFIFTATAAWTLDILSYTSGANNSASGFGFYTNLTGTIGDVSQGIQVGGPLSGLFNGGAGTFGISVNEFGSTSPATYSFGINIDTPAVPLPAGLPLLLAGLGGFALLTRKKRAA